MDVKNGSGKRSSTLTTAIAAGTGPALMVQSGREMGIIQANPT
jgi:hypothetical protein